MLPPSGFEHPLVLTDEAMFTIGGRLAATDHPGSSPITGSPGPGSISVDQLFVHRRIPATCTGIPVVMVHGSNASGSLWETTPDGREGWATWFVRQGHPVYVVDHAGRGRSGFDPTEVNRASADGSTDTLPNLFLATRERQWVNGRIGPDYPRPFPGVRFPVDSFDRFMASHVPNAESTLATGGATTVAALAELLDRIGPAAVVVHSQGGSYGIDLVRRRPDLVRCVVSVEGGSESLTATDARRWFSSVPLLSLWGDNSEGARLVNGDDRRNGCLRAVEMVVAEGGRAELLMLPDLGIRGNTHYLMMDDNNLDLAGLVDDWVERHT